MNAQTMAKSPGYQQAWLSEAGNPSTFAWIVAIFALLVQDQMVLRFLDPCRAEADELCTNSVALTSVLSAASLVSIVIASSFIYRDIANIFARNMANLAYIFLVVLSVAWSIHPDITFQRAIGCILSMLVGAYLSVRFGEKDRMKVFSLFFAISAIGSLLFVAAYPEEGIRYDDSGGFAMVGLYSHKNMLGQVMSIAILVELYLLVLGNWRPIWRFGLLSTYLTLLILSQSLTSLICGAFYLAGTAVYIIGRRDKLMAIIVAITLGLPLLFLQLGLLYNADLLLSFFGKDPSITGRADIWLESLDLIKQKPLLGWGYMATWSLDDPQFALIRERLQWPIPNAHSAYIDVTLQLGAVGLGLLLTIIAIASRRALACLRMGVPLGWFSLMLLVGALAYSIVETDLGQNQSIGWLLVNVFNFSCGLTLASLHRRGFAISYSRFVPSRSYPC
jgi:O-antigen ligase